MSLLLFLLAIPSFLPLPVDLSRQHYTKANKNVKHKQKERVVKNKLNIVEHCTQRLVQMY